MDFESESECGRATSRRSLSVAPSGSRLTLSAAPASLSVSSSHLSVSTSNLSGGGRRARAAPSLCESHRPPRVCLQRPCPALHVCRLFVEGFCPRGSNCRWGHSVLSADNIDILEEFELASLSERELLWMIRSLVRNTAPVSVEEYHRELTLCPEYAAEAYCQHDDCFRLHLCPRWVKGKCSATGCRWSHRLDNPDNVMVLLRLRCADMSEMEILTQLARNMEHDREDGHTTGDNAGDEGSSDSVDTQHWKNAESISSRSESVETAVKKRTHGPSVSGNVDSSSSLGCSDVPHSASGRGSSPEPGGQHGGNVAATGATGGKSLQRGQGTDFNAVKERTRTASVSGNVRESGSTSSLTQAVSESKSSSEHDVGNQLTGKQSKTPEARLEMDEIKRKALSLDICSANCYPSKCPLKDKCKQLHLCRFFLLDICTYSIGYCIKSHSLNSPHNLRVLRDHKLQDMPLKDLMKALRAGYIARYPITDMERRFLVQMCRPYQEKRCVQPDICTRIHVCKGYVEGTCEGSRACGRSHQLNSPYNAAILRWLGFTYTLSAADILEILKNPISAVNMQRSWLGNKSKVPSSRASKGLVAIPVQIDLHDRQTPGQDKNQGASPKKAETQKKESGSTSLKVVAAIAKNQESVLPSSDKNDEHRKKDKPLASGEPDLLQNHSLASAEGTVGSSGHFDGTQRPERVDRVSNDSQLADLGKEVTSSESMQAAGDTSFYNGPVLCAVHASGGSCSRDDCDGFHVCCYFLANLCRRPDDLCPLGHSFQSEHNMHVMQLYGLVSGSPEDFQALLDRMTLHARVTFKSGAHQKAQICLFYNSPEGCGKTGTCGRFHICQRFLSGTCMGPGCGLRHDLAGDHNECVRKSLGLISASPIPGQTGHSATDRDLIELLRARMGLKPGSYPIPEQKQPATEMSRAAAELRLVAELAKPTAPLSKPFAEVAKPSDGSPAKKKPTQLALCRRHCMGLRCSDANCVSLHICPHFVASSCRREYCPLGHQLNTKHNQKVLVHNGYTQISANQRELLKAVYAG